MGQTTGLNIGIAGAGIAGLASAILLARADHNITVYDQMSAPAPVGSGLVLQTTGLAVLSGLGLAEAAFACGQKIERLYGEAQGRPVLDVRYQALSKKAFGLAIHRASLFKRLYEAALSAGVQFKMDYKVIGADQGRLSFANQPASQAHDLIIDALGVRSPLTGLRVNTLPYSALWATLDVVDGAGFDLNTLEQRYVAARKMVGVLPVGLIPGDDKPKVTFFWSLKHRDYERWQAAGLEAWKDEVRRIWPQTGPLLDQITSPDQLTLARYAHHTLKRPYHDRIVHIGDSWHAASPQLGQGANMALLDAWALASALRAHENCQDILTTLKRFHSLRRHHVRLYQMFAWLFTPVYQSDSRLLPFLRDYLVPAVSRVPPFPRLLAALVAGTIGRPHGRLNLPAYTV
ncbi:MAG TPA: FAD-dependent monooxygenase [Hellea balneolensis]|uniref:FAD-dependent monooxygenase n=1 Tax=Hellea balneolensis TaxID=287478 RepID=A0A7V5NWN2_9PROT|nr:FAD-dependent monooxygenase [Hellea balneolensis]